MKEGILWDLIETLCSRDEKRLFLKMSDEKYSELEVEYNDLISTLKDKLDELGGGNE